MAHARQNNIPVTYYTNQDYKIDFAVDADIGTTVVASPHASRRGHLLRLFPTRYAVCGSIPSFRFVSFDTEKESRCSRMQ